MANKDKSRFSNSINIKNRRASYEYELIDKYVAGMQLMGTEIKSIREGKATLADAYCYFRNEELWVKQMHITPYAQGTHYNHDQTRERKLLLNKKELSKLLAKTEEKGMSIVPTRLFINERGFAKLEIALARGKKIHDKRDSIKEKDVKRDLQRMKF
ncbi:MULTISPECIES: SsrA-binding protein SmpB [Roseivirga]|jgi:SsrA-binding protein|uniref:SsrA-binding protein n=1 Tax=Roseivirga spongicola TaxID=333140 RepID=A0A150XBE5_9BACT|nr:MULTISPECIES: SsrA-binding protein SmpB [Roseivirga]PWL28959.1 MAG: SsrA-binding protein SmpB [Roseivirga sp. XM-24bin3]KYG76043.1 SsrA-binding protein [Roseivirga spongicola]MBO6494252.1 SsrA-binding protein SmpB [Roseivirga sp.]MBO6659226.1 SsrA-binding protein SmpB [Roseivirga sp.]MBO6762553.1 SsrA-binding protein SmpB [Roseivirga sp.]